MIEVQTLRYAKVILDKLGLPCNELELMVVQNQLLEFAVLIAKKKRMQKDLFKTDSC